MIFDRFESISWLEDVVSKELNTTLEDRSVNVQFAPGSGRADADVAGGCHGDSLGVVSHQGQVVISDRTHLNSARESQHHGLDIVGAISNRQVGGSVQRN